MIDRDKAADLMLPWWGLIGATFGWALSDQLASELFFDDCGHISRLAVVLIGIAGIAMAVGGGILSHRAWKRGRDETRGRRFIALIGMMAATLFPIAILLQTAASLIIPRCLG
jgi:Na+-driven multidrug efflux pump